MTYAIFLVYIIHSFRNRFVIILKVTLFFVIFLLRITVYEISPEKIHNNGKEPYLQLPIRKKKKNNSKLTIDITNHNPYLEMQN